MNEEIEELRCPLCCHRLYQKHEGMVCKNYKCKLYFKLGKGWVFLNKEKENSLKYLTDKYNYDINSIRNKERWLILKSHILYTKKRCEIYYFK